MDALLPRCAALFATYASGVPNPARSVVVLAWHRLPASWREAVLKARQRRKDATHARPLWTRRVMDESIARTLGAMEHQHLDVVEISGTAHVSYPWRSHTNRAFPEHDVCQPYCADPIADVVTCEQVLEHVVDPAQAVRSMVAMLRPGGTLVVSVPFMLRVHPHPEDYWRFTAVGLRRLLELAGLDIVSVESWGNHSVVRANLRRWAPDRPWRSIADDPLTPVVVWAVARKGLDS
jgi:hypothetical protein